MEGRFNGGFFALQVGGLTFGGAYFRNFTVLCSGLLFYQVKIHRVLYLSKRSGAHNQEREIPVWLGAQRFKDQFILRWIFSRNFEYQVSHSGADPGLFFLGGGALVSCSTSTPING